MEFYTESGHSSKDQTDNSRRSHKRKEQEGSCQDEQEMTDTVVKNELIQNSNNRHR